ncbi:hypothetical protein BC477_01310 [Clavibacter michiganensis subsp. michiganensis]|nr:hypothetical protein BC477_01310 [Clavibacter michiganensis subsp. michiganensis]
MPAGSARTASTWAGVFAVRPTTRRRSGLAASSIRRTRSAGTSDWPTCTPSTRTPRARAASTTSTRSSTSSSGRRADGCAAAWASMASAAATTVASSSAALACLSRIWTAIAPPATAAATTAGTPRAPHRAGSVTR